jgi:ABC-2 type transport system permease protein
MTVAGTDTSPRTRVTPFSIGTELRRQAGRPRTRIALAFLVALPLIILGAFELGRGDTGGGEGTGPFSTLVDVATSGGLNFALFTLFVSASFLLVVMVALFFGDTVASEASWGSLRYLLAVPVPRERLLGVKAVVALVTSLVGMLLLVGTALAAGTLRYGWHPLVSTVSQTIPPGPALLRLAAAAGYIFAMLLTVGALAFLLSVSTDAPLGAVGGAVLLQILSSILDQITALGSLRDVLPTHYAQAWLNLLATPVQTADLARGGIATVAYAALFFGLAWYRFHRKDIVS